MSQEYPESQEGLREQAETRLAKRSIPAEDLSPDEVKAMIHEYQVHQIELEIQNEELREAQRQLESARDRYAELFHHAPLGYLIIEQTGIIFQANQTFAVMLGLAPHNLRGTALGDHLVPSDRPVFYGRFNAFFKNPAGKELDFRLQAPSGDLTVRCVGRMENELQTPTGDGPGKRMLLAVSDISRQARAESILREREQHLQTILDTTRDGFWTLDMQGRVMDVNAAYCDMSGYTKDELRQLSIPDLEALESPRETEARIKRIIADGAECFETKHRRKDGSLFDVEVSVSFLEAGGGKFVCFCRDITDRRRAEAALRRSEAEFRALAENAPDIVARFDRHHRHVYINRVIEKHTGLPRASFLGRTNEDLNMPEERVAFWNRTLGDVFQHGRETEIFFDYPSPFGPKHFHSRIVPEFAPHGEVESLLAVTRDITEQKVAEEEIRRINRRLETANAEKNLLFTIIAHDLKSPMGGLLASTEVLANTPELFSEQDFRQLATELHKSAKNTYELLEDLLQWARLSQGGVDFAPLASSLGDLVNMGLPIAQRLANGKEIKIRQDISPELTVLADLPMIKTVIRNILFNAIKFTPRGGTIIITARQAEQRVTVAVQDNGVGMNEQVRSTLFTMGKEKRRLGTEGEIGTGLGLMLCKQLIDLHGGQIWVESEPGQGTTVLFALPGA